MVLFVNQYKTEKKYLRNFFSKNVFFDQLFLKITKISIQIFEQIIDLLNIRIMFW